MTPKQFTKYLAGLPNKLSHAMNDANEHINHQYISRLRQFSPIDTGQLHNHWAVESNIKNENGYQTIIKNDVYNSDSGRFYVHDIEYGSAVGSKPYPSIGKKTVLYNGRIYSSQAAGGMTQHINDDEVFISAEYLANNIIEAFK